MTALQFAFGFQDINSGGLCHIKDAEIVTQKVTLPISVSAEHRFTLPTEKALKQARAVVKINLIGQANQCDMSVQLETKPEFLKIDYSHDELIDLFTQYQTFFSQMGGFMSFLMPDVSGLRLFFGEVIPDPTELPTDLTVSGQQLVINKDWLLKGEDLPLGIAPYRITAVTQ